MEWELEDARSSLDFAKASQMGTEDLSVSVFSCGQRDQRDDWERVYVYVYISVCVFAEILHHTPVYIRTWGDV